MDLSAYLYIRTNVVIVVVSCLMRSFLIDIVCMSDSLRASMQIYTVTISSVPWPKRERSAI